MDKIKNEKEIESDNKNCDVDISNACRELMRYYENITGRCNGIDYGKLRLSVNIHGEINVKNDIDKVVMFEGEGICVKCRKKIGRI